MLQQDFTNFFKILADLKPILVQLTGRTRIVWLNQYPTFDVSSNIVTGRDIQIHAEKIRRYNELVRTILK